MTENEAIEILDLDSDMRKKLPNLVEVYDVAVKALSEIQQYRAIGTVEEIKSMKKEEDILKFYYCESEDEYYIGKRI